MDRIIPWLATRSIGKTSEKFQITAREASKQSRRFRIPEVTGVAQTSQICEAIKLSDLAIVFHESADTKLSDQITSGSVENLLIIIGPEGGISDDEIAQFESANGAALQLGENVLRSAHAGFAALSAIAVMIGRW